MNASTYCAVDRNADGYPRIRPLRAGDRPVEWRRALRVCAELTRRFHKYGAPVASAPVAATPVASAPVAATPVASAPVAATPVAATPLAATPLAATPLAATPLAAYRY